MSYIPDVRAQYVHPLYQNTKGAQSSEPQENAYWEGNLDEKNREFAEGYDYAAREADSFFENLCDDLISEENLEELRVQMAEWMEASRNEAIVALIDRQDAE